MPVPLERRPLIAVSMMLMMGINLVSAQDTNSSNSSNAAGFFNCCKSAGLEILREEVRKIARARGLNYEPSRAARVQRSRGTGISVNSTLKGLGVFNEEQRRTLELELPRSSNSARSAWLTVAGSAPATLCRSARRARSGRRVAIAWATSPTSPATISP